MKLLEYLLYKDWIIRLLILFNRNKTIILTYHGICQKISDVENYEGKHISKQKFLQQIEFLKKHFNIISLEYFIYCCINNKRIPNLNIILTFDDGYKNNYDVLFPILKENKIPATIFVLPELINKKEWIWVSKIEKAVAQTKQKFININNKNFRLNNSENKIKFLKHIKRIIKESGIKKSEKLISESLFKLRFNKEKDNNHDLMSWKEIKIMSKNNISFGSHTMTHELLTTLDKKGLELEINVSRKILLNKLKIKNLSFSYPNGDFNKLAKNIAKESSYFCALTTKYGQCNKNSDLFELNRVSLLNNMSMHYFKLNLFFNPFKLEFISTFLKYLHKF